jgi:steroid 5-alpha reductase family enzyme
MEYASLFDRNLQDTNEDPDFQNAKAHYKKTGQASLQYPAEDLDRGFVVTGLWSWSRHPNFAAEQAIWVCLYQWATYVAESYVNWTIVGPVAYLILFQASTWFTELVSAGKYPEYKEYQVRVGKFLPRMTTDAPGDFSDVTERETASEALSKKAEKAKKKAKDAVGKTK